MIILISPAKKLDFKSPLLTQKFTQPQYLSDAKVLIKYCQKLTPADLQSLMSISPKLAELNYERFQNWQNDPTLENARQAIQAFKGDVYEGLQVEDFSDSDFKFAQTHLRILSGLYGILRPLDLIQPYRLEMGIKLPNGKNSNLYQFWGDRLTHNLNDEEDPTVINLASNEYFKAIQPQKLNAKLIQPIFLDEKNGKYKIISFYAKKARGLMSRFIIKNQLQQVEDLKNFDLAGYHFDKSRSTESVWAFVRPER
ncbi:peroxide stress protein YaaA [Xylocopilactobacillus apis]|uniref:UPF0246 protein KIMC2_03400 n=1 Tax=Xylocopilactobacillus apis TaxID=2932183 RepID=A0AAU9DLR6_9LACO|nr:peroxide stress protein YaaA [Xylocopilactobacillus apis]BDR55778.1 UPF0246 protein [Xylocopilactobacillus apis]